MRSKQVLQLLIIILSPFFTFAQSDLKEIGKVLFAEKKSQIIVSANIDSVYKLSFSKYTKMELYNLDGVHLISDLTLVIEKDSIDSLSALKNLVKFNSQILNRKVKESSDPFDPNYKDARTTQNIIPEKVGYKFLISKLSNNELLNDTLIVFRSTRNKIYAFLASELNKSADNILMDEELRQKKLDEANSALYLKAIKGYEKLLFPYDSIFVVGVNFLIERSSNDFGNGLSSDDSLFSKGFVLSSMKDLKKIKENINKANNSKSDTWNYWSVDTVWIEKAIYYKELGNLNSAISFYSTGENDMKFDTDFAMEEAKKDKKRLKVYTTLDLLKNEIPDIFIDKSDFSIRYSASENGIVSLNVVEKLYGKRIDDRTNVEYKWKSYLVSSNNIFKRIDDFNVELFDQKYDTRVDEPSYFSLINLDFTNRGSGSQELNLSKNTGGFVRYSKYGYGLKPIEVKKIMAYYPCVKFVRAMDKLLEEQENEIEKEKLIKQYSVKYGRTFVQQAFDGNVIVGMHEDLLPVALKMWKVNRKTLVTGGYYLYLYSPFDTSIHVFIKVLNKKVTYVGTW